MKMKDALVGAAITTAVIWVTESYGDYCYKRGWKKASKLHGILEKSQRELIDSLNEKLKKKEEEV